MKFPPNHNHYLVLFYVLLKIYNQIQFSALLFILYVYIHQFLFLHDVKQSEFTPINKQ